MKLVSKPECPACGSTEYQSELRPCPYCDCLKCEQCDMGDDVGCAACDASDADIEM